MTHLDHLLKKIPDLKERNILDLGAGRGSFLIEATKRGWTVEGLEYNPSYIDEAFRRAEKEGVEISLRQGAGESLPYPDKSFSFINMAEVLEHVQNPEKVLSEVVRVLDVEGVAYVSIPNRFGFYDPHFHLYGVNWLPRVFSEHYIRLFKKQKDYKGEAGHQKLSDMHYMTKNQFVKLCSLYGLVYQDSRELRFKNIPLGFGWMHFYRLFSFFFIPTFHGLLFPSASVSKAEITPVFIKKIRQLWCKILNAKPPTYSKSLLLNILGMQLMITLFYRFLYIIKGSRTIPQKYKNTLTTLQRDGFVIVKDFLPQKEYLTIKKEFEHLLPHFQTFDTYTKVVLPHVERLNIEDQSIPDTTRTLFLEHPLIVSVAQGFLRRRKLFDVRAYFTRISIRDEEELNQPQDGGTTNLHIDAPLPVLKFFYFLKPVSEKNGTLEYVKGSQKRKIRILWLEYLHSIRYALNKWRPHPTGQYDLGRPWVEVTDREVEKYGLNLEPVIVPGNTLVILNPGGYHRRGAMTHVGERQAVEISFRNADTLRNYLKAFWS